MSRKGLVDAFSSAAAHYAIATSMAWRLRHTHDDVDGAVVWDYWSAILHRRRKKLAEMLGFPSPNFGR